MGRNSKEKNNYEKQFDLLYTKKEISGNADLLRKMYRKYYKNKLENDDEEQVWIDSQLSDFRKKIKGQGRTFTESDIMAIERALDMSWVDIVDPLPESQKKKIEKFEASGLRYTAYMDRDYQELADSYDINEYNPVLCNYDEYGKTIVDYIIEYKSRHGLNFLIDKGYIGCNGFLEFHGSIYGTEDHSDQLWDWIIAMDDAELFLKALGEKNLFDVSFSNAEKKDDFLEKIFNHERLWESLCKERIYHDNNEWKYMPGLLFELLKYSLNKNKQNETKKIISAYRNFIEDQRLAFQNKISQENNKNFKIENLHATQRKIYYDESLVMILWDFSALTNKYDSFEDQIEYCQIQNIINRLKVKKISAMEYGDSFIQDGIYHIKKKPDVSLEALKYLTAEKGCKFLPTYIGEESGVTKISTCKTDWRGVDADELGKILGEIHALSQEKLGSGQVYMYSCGFTNGFGYTLDKKTKVITNWHICHIGTPIRDIVTAFLNCGYLHEYFETTHSFMNSIEIKGKSYQAVSQFLNSYPNKKVIENFGDQFNAELDKMLMEANQRKDNKNIAKLHLAKIFAEIYRQDLNHITNYNCYADN